MVSDRRLAAILSADVAGYSRLIAEDEEGTVRRLATCRDEVGILVPSHRGRVVDFTGDEFLAEFPTALEAVQAAFEIQRVIGVLNADLPVERRMEFRMGVHLGDIRVEGERIHGDGVNIAARLQGLAEPGGICISGEVHGQVEAKLDLRYEDLGQQEVKNIPRPVRVYRLVAEPGVASKPTASRWRSAALALGTALVVGVIGLVVWQLWLGPAREPIPPESETEVSATEERFTVPGFGGAPAIAVLAFDNLSGDPEQEYFAHGIAEDLITRLSEGGRFPVIARNSSFTYKGRAVDVQQVGRELGARYVVEGSVRRAGEDVRISVQLIDATTGTHRWAESYDREFRDVFALQDEIVEDVARHMGLELRQSEWLRAVREQPREPAAYDLVMRGWWHLARESKEDNSRARSFFERATELDPSYTEAWLGLARTHNVDLVTGWTDSPAASLGELGRAARACIEADSQDANCHLVLSQLHDRRGERAEHMAALERAINLDPGNADAQGWMGFHLSYRGVPAQALAHLETAMRLDPISPLQAWWQLGVAYGHFDAARYEAATDWARQGLRPASTNVPQNLALAASLGQLDRIEEARAVVTELTRTYPELTVARVIASTSPFRVNPDFDGRYLDGLRKAGLPEE